LVYLGLARFAAGDITGAQDAYGNYLQLERGLANRQRTAACLEGLAAVALACAEPERAARLLGAAAQMVASVEVAPYPLPPRLHAEREQIAARAQQALGEEAWEAAFTAGEALSPDDALAEALESSRV
jgi:hypothetical protein